MSGRPRTVHSFTTPKSTENYPRRWSFWSWKTSARLVTLTPWIKQRIGLHGCCFTIFALQLFSFRWYIYWKSPEEWGKLIYIWANSRGMTNAVCTIYELVAGEDTTDEGTIFVFIVFFSLNVAFLQNFMGWRWKCFLGLSKRSRLKKRPKYLMIIKESSFSNCDFTNVHYIPRVWMENKWNAYLTLSLVSFVFITSPNKSA